MDKPVFKLKQVDMAVKDLMNFGSFRGGYWMIFHFIYQTRLRWIEKALKPPHSMTNTTYIRTFRSIVFIEPLLHK